MQIPFRIFFFNGKSFMLVFHENSSKNSLQSVLRIPLVKLCFVLFAERNFLKIVFLQWSCVYIIHTRLKCYPQCLNYTRPFFVYPIPKFSKQFNCMYYCDGYGTMLWDLRNNYSEKYFKGRNVEIINAWRCKEESNSLI